MDTLVRLNGDSSETFSIVKPGKPRNEIANLSTMARVEKKKKIPSRREIWKIWKPNSIKKDHDTLFWITRTM